jgi:hypothetical protein
MIVGTTVRPVIIVVSPITLYHSLSPIPNTLYRCIRLYIKNQHGRVVRACPFGDIRRQLNYRNGTLDRGLDTKHGVFVTRGR